MAKLSQPPVLAARWQAAIDDHVIGLAWSGDGTRLAAASVSGPVTIFEGVSGKVLHTLPGHGFGTTCIAWQPGGDVIASSGQDGKVRLWDARSGQLKKEIAAGTAWVELVRWNPKGTMLVSAGGKKLALWSEDGEPLRTYPEQPASVADVQWAAKGKEFLSAGYWGVTFWSPESDEPLNRFVWRGSVLAVAWSPDGKYIAGGAQDASVHFWYAKDGKDLEMAGYPQKVRELSWDAGSTYLATGGGHQVTVWNCSGKGPAGSKPLSFELHEEPVSDLRFQNRGPLLASACGGGLLALWLPGGSKKVLSQANVGQGISQIRWAPNDQRLSVGGDEGLVGVWTV